MKNLLLSIIFLFVSNIISGQNVYRAFMTEMYVYNKNTQEWDLYDKNSDVNIRIVVEDKFVTIQAKTPSMYKVYEGTKEPFSSKSLVGSTYEARDLREDMTVKIDILRDRDNTFMLLNIVNRNQGFNFRFYILPEEEK